MFNLYYRFKSYCNFTRCGRFGLVMELHRGESSFKGDTQSGLLITKLILAGKKCSYYFLSFHKNGRIWERKMGNNLRNKKVKFWMFVIFQTKIRWCRIIANSTITSKNVCTVVLWCTSDISAYVYISKTSIRKNNS